MPNVICQFLGGGSYDEAISQTVAHNLEVVDLKRLDEWSEQTWDVENRSRLNTSTKFVSMEDLSALDLEYARGIMEDDAKYHASVMSAYDRHGGTSVRGRQLIPGQ